MSEGAAEGRDDQVVTVTADIDPSSVLVFSLVAIGAAAAWAVVTIAPDMVTRVAVGVVLGVALTPLVAAHERRFGTSRVHAAAMVGAGLVMMFTVMVLLVAPAAVSQASDFSSQVPETVRELYSWPIIGPRLEDADAAGQVEDFIDDLPAKFDDRTLADLGERLLGGALATVVVVVTAIGVLLDGELLVQRVRSLVPPSRQPRADAAGRIVNEAFGSYFAGSLVVAVLNGLVTLTAGLLLGVPLAPVAALWCMLTNLIPQIGGFLGGSFFVLLALTESPLTAVLAAAVFLGYQQFENNVVGPAIVGTAVNLTPPATMLAALIGGAAAGVPGALVATPLLAAAKAIYLHQRGELPPPHKPALTRRLQARVARVKGAVEERVRP